MDTGFFKWIWRFNALAIALVVIVTLAAITYELGRDLARSFFPTRTTNTLNVSPDDAPDAETADETVKRYFSAPTGTSPDGIYALPLYVEQNYTNRGISKSSGGNLMNYRIVQTDAPSNRWLFPAAERLIMNTNALVLRKRGEADLHLGHLMTVIDADTNGDNRLSARDSSALYLTDANWGEPVKITDGVRVLLNHSLRTSDTVDLVFDTDGGTHIAQVNLRSGNILSQQIITPLD